LTNGTTRAKVSIRSAAKAGWDTSNAAVICLVK
jgi:hypothetical protein